MDHADESLHVGVLVRNHIELVKVDLRDISVWFEINMFGGMTVKISVFSRNGA